MHNFVSPVWFYLPVLMGCTTHAFPPLPPLQIEDIVTRIQDEKAGGVSIRTVKSFLSKIPSVVSGWCPCCLVKWRNESLEPHITTTRATTTFGPHLHHGFRGWGPPSRPPQVLHCP